MAACCVGPVPPNDESGPEDETAVEESEAPVAPFDVAVEVTLDGQPAEGVIILQGGRTTHWRTDASGRVTVQVDTSIDGDWVLHASHPDARIEWVMLDEPPEEPLTLALVRFDRSDNEQYVFQDPGTPEINQTTAYCSHCHRTLVDDWFDSAHSRSSSNPVLHDVYTGTAHALAEEAACISAGGKWWTGRAPGGGDDVAKCYLGDGALPSYNAGCGDSAPCDDVATETGACADCHAPAIDGVLGGRDLLEAEGLSYLYGVHCDFCHKVESVDLEAPAGVAGRLKVIRPSETGSMIDPFSPLMFGPYHDVPNPRMGSVQRDHFLEAPFCAGCHEQDQELVPVGSELDRSRWPDGLPVQSTYSEWLAGPYSPGAPCQSCHMPPDADVWNAADLQLFETGMGGGFAQGWVRPPGTVRRHVWYGPRSPESGMLQAAAALDVEHGLEDGELVVRVVTTNAGAGHAIPTGEPMRSLVLHVEATCEGATLQPVGGHVVPDFGGHLGRREAGEDWSRWLGAKPGQVLRVVRRTGEWHDYPGVGRFGDGSFSAEEKGMPVEVFVGQSTVLSVDEEGGVSLDAPLPAGDVVYLGEPGAPADGEASSALAGAPGFAFARLLVAPDGRRHVHHSSASDLASDNRLMPQQAFTTEHRFEPCESPAVRAVLVHRAYPVGLARERRWSLMDSVMVEVQR